MYYFGQKLTYLQQKVAQCSTSAKKVVSASEFRPDSLDRRQLESIAAVSAVRADISDLTVVVVEHRGAVP